MQPDNRKAWDLRTAIHVSSPFYAVDAFRTGVSTLRPPELELVGDVTGRKLLHLQCHFGLDTLSWGRLGAIPTGVDFSEASITVARALSRETEIAADFVCADVQSLDDRFERRFDVVVASYGVMCWLNDLAAWARGINGSLRPGGRFVLVEYHPIMDVLFDGKVSGTCAYFGPAAGLVTESSGTYAAPDAPIHYVECRWQHPVSEVVMALIEAGLSLRVFREYEYSSYPLFPALECTRPGAWTSGDARRLPYMYGLVVEAPGG